MSTLEHSFIIFAGTCKGNNHKSFAEFEFGQISSLTAELSSFEHLKNRCIVL